MTVETEGTVETHGTAVTNQEIYGICDNLRTPPISPESREKSPTAHAGKDGNNQITTNRNGGQEKITNDSPDESQKFGKPQDAGLPDESARVVMPTHTLQDIEQACKEWERSHQQNINSNNLTKVTFDLKPQFPDITADDLAHLIRKYARISKPIGNNGNHPEHCGIIKEHKMIKLRFLVDNIPVFVGMDGRGYGPFQKGMEAEIPAVNAMALLKREAAVKIEDRIEGAKR